jgi:polysaccharide deacetylase 2 family uncharacterized protein YibQ
LTVHPAGVWEERNPPAAGVLALLLLAVAGSWVGWNAYRGDLGGLFSATPRIEVDLRAAGAAPAETTPRVVIDLTPSAPAPSAAALASIAPSAPAIPLPQPVEPAPPAAASLSPPHGLTADTALASIAALPAPAALPAAPSVAAPLEPGAAALEEPVPDLLAEIGAPPAPVLQPMALPAPSAAAPAASAPAAQNQEASAAQTFLPPVDAFAPAWRRYARPFDGNDPRPRIAIVITNLGLLHGATLSAIDQLPGDVTLSFNPYASSLDGWIAHARSLGHEVMLDLPMEPGQGGDAGPEGLSASLSLAENQQRLGWLLARTNGFIGLAGVPGEQFAASPAGLQLVLGGIASQGLMLLDTRPGAAGPGSAQASGLPLPRAMADLTIDDLPDRVAIDAQLAKLERRARSTGFAVGLAFGYPVTIERLAEWSRGLPDRNLALAPVSAIAGRQARP